MLVCVIVGCGHAITVLACRDGDIHHNLYCILPEGLEGYKVVCLAGVLVAMEYPQFLFLGKEARAVEYGDTNVENVFAHDWIS